MFNNVKPRWLLLNLFILLILTSCTTIYKSNNSYPSLQVNTSNAATGTGFLFSSSDYVITSYHVVHGSKSISVRLINGVKIDAKITVQDTQNDIAILKLSKPPTSRQNIITLGDSSSVKTGDRVFTYGFPLVHLLGNAEPRYSEGFVNSLSGISNDPRLFQVSIPIQPGNSGGPVFNEKGELIGIATSSIDADKTRKVFGSSPQNVNFAIKSSYINSLLTNLPDTFIKKKGIVPVPIGQTSFKERVKNDIVLVEVVPQNPRNTKQPLPKNNSLENSQRKIIKPSSVNQKNIKKLKSLNNCNKCNLSGANLSRESLKGANMVEANLSYVNLSHADLSESNLTGSNLNKANLEGTNLRQANLSKADFSYAKLDKSNLIQAKLSGSNLDGASLVKTNLSFTTLTNASFKNSILTKANLTGANLTGANLSHASLGGANLKRARMHEVNLTGADLTGADLPRSMKGVNLTGANLTNAILVDVDFSGADLTKANLTGASLTGAKIDKATLCNTITPWGLDNSGC